MRAEPIEWSGLWPFQTGSTDAGTPRLHLACTSATSRQSLSRRADVVVGQVERDESHSYSHPNTRRSPPRHALGSVARRSWRPEVSASASAAAPSAPQWHSCKSSLPRHRTRNPSPAARRATAAALSPSRYRSVTPGCVLARRSREPSAAPTQLATSRLRLGCVSRPAQGAARSQGCRLGDVSWTCRGRGQRLLDRAAGGSQLSRTGGSDSARGEAEGGEALCMRRGVTSAAPRRKGKRFEGGRGGGREGRREGPGTAARPPPARPKALWERFSSARPLPCNLAVSSVISGDLAQRGCWERGPPPPPLRAPGAGSRSCELSRSRGLQVEVGCRQQWAAGSRSCELSRSCATPLRQ